MDRYGRSSGPAKIGMAVTPAGGTGGERTGVRPMRKYLASTVANQKGITGLETAIILIAFVVVASVFAFTVLSTGIFSAEKGKEAVNSGLQTARSSMELVGSVVAKDTDADDEVEQGVFTR